MNETAILRAKVPARRLQRAGEILQKLGLTPSDAVNRVLSATVRGPRIGH